MSNRKCEFMSKKWGGGSDCREFYQVWIDASLEDVKGVDGVEQAYPTFKDGKIVSCEVFIDPRYSATGVLKAIEALTATTSPDYSALVEEGVYE